MPEEEPSLNALHADASDIESLPPCAEYEGRTLALRWTRRRPNTRTACLTTMGVFCVLAFVGGVHYSNLRNTTNTQGSSTALVASRSLTYSHLDGRMPTNSFNLSYSPLMAATQGVPGMPVMLPDRSDRSDITDDKGICEEDEEVFFFLCYKKCSIMTDGAFPKRIAPDACAKCSDKESCYFPAEVSVKGFFCGGYAISSEGHCPHPPGFCNKNEEVHLGICYMKCDYLTGGEYPIRIAANTCCKEEPCWNIFNLKSRGIGCHGFGVSGEGKCGHRPQQKASLPNAPPITTSPVVTI